MYLHRLQLPYAAIRMDSMPVVDDWGRVEATHVCPISTWGKHATTPVAKFGLDHVNFRTARAG